MFPALLSLQAPTMTGRSRAAALPVNEVLSANTIRDPATTSSSPDVFVASADESAVVLPQNNRAALFSLSLGALGAAAINDPSSEITSSETTAAQTVTDTTPADAAENASDIDSGAQELQQLKQLQQRDTEVRSHEQAHAAVGGIYAGQPQFDYEHGTDGKRYAVDGEVHIDVAVIPKDPQATMNKMKQVYAAAMAPMAPSAADIQVAAEAMRKYNMAREQLTSQRNVVGVAPLPEDTQQPNAKSPATTEMAQSSDANAYPLGITRLMGQVNAQQKHAITENFFAPSIANHVLNDISLPNATLEVSQTKPQGATMFVQDDAPAFVIA